MIGSDRKYAVLVVENERIVAKDLQQMLVGMGYDAFAIASSSAAALKWASERCPDVVLMDIRINGPLDGVETAGLLRDRFGVPVVYLTAHADETTLERAKQTEPYGYLMKPVRPAELRSAIEISIYRHQMTRRLRERERWFSTTLRSIADAVITVDLAGLVTFMNPAAETLTGVTADFALGRPAREIVRLLDPNQPTSPLDEALARREVVIVEEAPIAHATSEGRIISDSASPVVDGGELLGAVMVFRDITRQKLLQKQLELSDRLASLGTMAAGVAHEINNPLASIAGNAAYVLDELRSLQRVGVGDPEKLAEAIRAQVDLESSTARIAKIVSSLRVFSRPVAQVAVGEADVGLSVEWAVRATAHEFRYRATVVATVGASLPRAKIDDTRLGQVLVNLLVNAAHAIDPGHLERNWVSVEAQSEGDTIVVEVRDTGVGMTEEVSKHIFEPFFTTKPVGLGTGLGLAICHGIVASLGGRLEAESEEGKGTLVRVVLPAATMHAHLPTPEVETSAETRIGRILAIDDEPLLLRAIKRTLREHDVVCVDDARQAIALIAKGEQFDLIITDMLMPHMTGKEMYERLLLDYPASARKVLFMTGGAIGEDGDAFLSAVPNESVNKPVLGAALRDLVQRVLRDQHTRRG